MPVSQVLSLYRLASDWREKSLRITWPQKPSRFLTMRQWCWVFLEHFSLLNFYFPQRPVSAALILGDTFPEFSLKRRSPALYRPTLSIFLRLHLHGKVKMWLKGTILGWVFSRNCYHSFQTGWNKGNSPEEGQYKSTHQSVWSVPVDTNGNLLIKWHKHTVKMLNCLLFIKGKISCLQCFPWDIINYLKS